MADEHHKSITDADDERYPAARQYVIETQNGSTPHLQRRLQCGFNPAARLIERMEREGVLGAYSDELKKAPRSGEVTTANRRGGEVDGNETAERSLAETRAALSRIRTDERIARAEPGSA